MGCNSCGSDAKRTISVLRDGVFVDKCPQCSPADFPRFIAPSDLKIVTGYQANPERYKKSEGKDGQPIFRATDVELQDMHDWACREDEEEKKRYEAAVEKRRRYAAEMNLKPETAEEAERNAEAARRMLRQIEAEVSLEAMGVVLPEGI